MASAPALAVPLREVCACWGEACDPTAEPEDLDARLRRAVGILGICLALITACGDAPSPRSGDTQQPPAPRIAPQTAIEPPPPGSGAGGTALTWTTPPGWVAETPSTSMRKAQYRVSGEAGDAECIVFYFGPGQGGDALTNAQRWAGQFTLADGRPGSAGMTVENRKVGDIDVLIVAVSGTHQGGFRMQGETEPPKPDQGLLGAIAEGPDANWFFKLTGPRATVEAQRAAFDDLVGSLKRGAAPENDVLHPMLETPPN